MAKIDTLAAEKPSIKTKVPKRSSPKITRHIHCYTLACGARTWELYPIVFLAAFLRFYQLSTTEFDNDQATIFSMARAAITHGLIPATSNIASVRIVNPPAVIYLFMPVAAFTADPLWGVMLVGIFNVAAVFLTYVFVRRYYGRLAGMIAALFYGTAAQPVHFSRFIWQQNLIAPFVVLFLFALFRGAVERRRGWLFPALLLSGVLIQLHETTTLLIIPFVAALLLARGMLRWRDFVCSLVALVVLFFTYLLWEVSTQFNDLHVLLLLAKNSAHFDRLAVSYYILFLSPSTQPSANTHSFAYVLAPLVDWVFPIMLFLLAGGIAVALKGIVFPDRATLGFRNWWTHFRASAESRGLLLLLIWQLAPLLVLSRHSVPVYPYYLLALMPGPFILIGIFLSKVIASLQGRGRYWQMGRSAVPALVCLLVILQCMSSFATLTSEANGTNPHSDAYNTLGSLQSAVNEIDHLTQQYHFKHIYIATDQYTQSSLDYLAYQIQTPITLFDASRCLILPNPADGPAALLVGPSDTLTIQLLQRFARATLIDQPGRLGGRPFRLYRITPLTEPAPHPPSNVGFTNNLQLVDKSAHVISFNTRFLLIARWRILRSERPSYRASYSYLLAASFNGETMHGTSVQNSLQALCAATDLWPGDQLITAFGLAGRSVLTGLPATSSLPAALTITASYFTTTPFSPSYGPFVLETIRDQRGLLIPLHTLEGTLSITVPVSS